MARLCEPDQIVWINGSEDERDRLTKEAVSGGELILSNQGHYPGCLASCAATNDVARPEELTYICTTKRRNASPTSNSMSSKNRCRKVKRSTPTR